jgi:hypothetical protein
MRPYFDYDERAIIRRLWVSSRVLTSFSTSIVQKLAYRTWCKYATIGSLILIGVALTPQALPSWLGFEWATPRM